jgi:outer membrane lipoprotein-sorting protein
MKSLKLGMLALITLIGSITIQAQTADEIVNKHIDAIGGKDKVAGVKTLSIESTLEVMGNEAPSTTLIVNGMGYKSETDFNGQKIITCITDKGGWSLNPMMGQTAPEALPAEQLKASQNQLQIGGPLFNYASKGNKVELVGREDVGGVSTYKLKCTTKDSVVSNYFIDPNTYYVVKAVTSSNTPGQEGETTITFSNYQKTDFGYVFPMGQQITLPQGISLNITHKKVEVNKDIDPKVFEMPKS